VLVYKFTAVQVSRKSIKSATFVLLRNEDLSIWAYSCVQHTDSVQTALGPRPVTF